MNIVMFARTLPFHSIGGMQAVAWDLSRALAARGEGVTLVTTRISDAPGEFVSEGIKVVQFQDTTPERCDHRWWKASLEWLRSQREGSVDVVIGVSSAALMIARHRREFPSIRLIFQAHGTSYGEFLSKVRTGRVKQVVTSLRNLLWIRRDILHYRQVDAIVAVGRSIVSDLERWPYSRRSVPTRRELIENGVDTLTFSPREDVRRERRVALGFDAGHRVAIFVGRLHPQKGARRAIDAIAHLAQRDASVRLLIVGDGPEREALERHIGQRDLQAMVRMLGPVSREEVGELLCAADTFVFPTCRKEGLPLNVLEALACGLPVVCPLELQDIFGEIDGLHYVDIDRLEALSSTLSDSLQQGWSAQPRIPPQYALDATADSYLNLLRTIDAPRTRAAET